MSEPLSNKKHQYECICCHCGKPFYGDKREVSCPNCSKTNRSLSKVLGLESKPKVEYNSEHASWGNYDDSYSHGYDGGYSDGHNDCVKALDQRSPDVKELAFIIYKVGMRNLTSEDEIKSIFNMHHVTWNPTVNECYVKAQEIINKMSVWLVKKG